MRKAVGLLVAHLSLVAGGVDAQSSSTRWTRLPNLPGPIQEHAMVFDSRRGAIWLYGGLPDLTFSPHMPFFMFDGRQWNVMPWVGVPPLRYRHVMAYDVHRDRIVVFGGVRGAASLLDETWEWDGVAWTQRQPSHRPHARVSACIAYDEARRKTLLFGGSYYESGGLPQHFNDMWEWDGTDWKELFPIPMPPGGRDGAMTYDSARQVVVLSDDQADTWEWDGSVWTRTVKGAVGLSNLAYHAYHAARGRVVAVGQTRAYEYDGSTWRSLARPPLGYEYGWATVYDPIRRIVLHAGGQEYGTVESFTSDKVWALDTVNPSGVFAAGSGCSGSAGLVGLDPYRGSEPWAGSNFTLALSGSASATAAFGFLGSSESIWAGLALPISLAALGSPSCSLHTGPELVMPLPLSTAMPLWSIPIPAAPALVGRSFYLQAALLGDPAAPVLTSNSSRARIGQL